jgi:hypothetical protein
MVDIHEGFRVFKPKVSVNQEFLSAFASRPIERSAPHRFKSDQIFCVAVNPAQEGWPNAEQ